MTVESNIHGQESSLPSNPFSAFQRRLAERGVTVQTPEERHKKHVREQAAALDVETGFQQFIPDGPLNFEDNVKSLIEWITYANGEIPESVGANLQIIKEMEDTYEKYVKSSDGSPDYEAELSILRADLDSQKQVLVDDTFHALKKAGEAVYGEKALASNREAQAALRETSDAKEVIEKYPELGRQFESAINSLDNTREVFRLRNTTSLVEKNLPKYSGWSGSGYPVGEKNFATSEEAESYLAERERVVPQTSEFIVGTFIKRLESNVLAESGVEDKRQLFDSNMAFKLNHGVVGAPNMEKEAMKKLWLEMFRMSIQESFMNSHSRTDHRQDFSIICQKLYLYSRAFEGTIAIDENGRSPERLVSHCPDVESINIKNVFSTINKFDPDFFTEMCAILRVNGHEIKKEEKVRSGVYSFDNDLLETKEFFIDPNGIPYRKGQHDEDISAIEKNIGEIVTEKTLEGNVNIILTAKQGAEVANKLQTELLEARVREGQLSAEIKRLNDLLSRNEKGYRNLQEHSRNLDHQLQISLGNEASLIQNNDALDESLRAAGQKLLVAEGGIKRITDALTKMTQKPDTGVFGFGKATVPVADLIIPLHDLNELIKLLTKKV